MEFSTDDLALIRAALRHSSRALAEQSKGYLPDFICDKLERLATRIEAEGLAGTYADNKPTA